MKITTLRTVLADRLDYFNNQLKEVVSNIDKKVQAGMLVCSITELEFTIAWIDKFATPATLEEGKEVIPVDKVKEMIRKTLTITLEGFQKWLKEDAIIVYKDTRDEVPGTEINIKDNAKAPTDYIYPELKKHGITFIVPDDEVIVFEEGKEESGGDDRDKQIYNDLFLKHFHIEEGLEMFVALEHAYAIAKKYAATTAPNKPTEEISATAAAPIDEQKVVFFVKDNNGVWNTSKPYTIKELVEVAGEEAILEDMEKCTCSLNESNNHCEGDCIKFDNGKIVGHTTYSSANIAVGEQESKLQRDTIAKIVRHHLDNLKIHKWWDNGDLDIRDKDAVSGDIADAIAQLIAPTPQTKPDAEVGRMAEALQHLIYGHRVNLHFEDMEAEKKYIVALDAAKEALAGFKANQ